MLKKISILLSLVLTFIFVGCFGTNSDIKDTPTTTVMGHDRTLDTVSAETAKDIISTITSLTIIDVRTPAEYKDGYINGAVNINYYSDAFQEDLSKYDRDKPYLIYCKSGYRSGKTLIIMRDLGFNEVHNLDGGFENWKSKGFPIVK